jgi:hypothetical protein
VQRTGANMECSSCPLCHEASDALDCEARSSKAIMRDMDLSRLSLMRCGDLNTPIEGDAGGFNAVA